jgi:hypothetical protein
MVGEPGDLLERQIAKEACRPLRNACVSHFKHFATFLYSG